MSNKIFQMQFSAIYPLLVSKAEKKGRSKSEVDQIITWLTGYDDEAIQQQLDNGVSYETFFTDAPQINPNSSRITGTICGHRVEEIEDPTMRQIRYLDKLVDELAKGKTMDQILRT